MIQYKMKMALVLLVSFFVFYGVSFAAWDKDTGIIQKIISSVILARSATVSWHANFPQELYGYKVYIGTESRNYSDCVFVEKTSTSHSFNKLSWNKIYYFCVTSVNNSGVESGYSQEVVKKIQWVRK